MKITKKILLSGVKPTGRPHIGNYFGAMRQFVELQDKYESYVCIVDYHALTTLHNPKELSQYSLEMALDFLAIGLDPKKVTLFKQSDVPEVTELGWIFNCITTMPYLERAHAYKDAIAKGREVNVGTFDYPILMAADILIQDADVVPVGQDQKQHVEYARDTADKFNRIFASTSSAQAAPVFKLPDPIILKEVETIKGTDGQKMSKSYNNTIPLFANRSEIVESVMGIVTDSKSDVPENVYGIHKLFRPESDLKPIYEANKGKYKVLKEALIEDIDSVLTPMRLRRDKFETGLIKKILDEGGKKARFRAQKKIKLVRSIIGVSP